MGNPAGLDLDLDLDVNLELDLDSGTGLATIGVFLKFELCLHLDLDLDLDSNKLDLDLDLDLDRRRTSGAPIFSLNAQVFGCVTAGEPFMVIMEFLEKGDLRKYVQENGKDMTEDQLISICENVTCVFVHLLSPFLLIKLPNSTDSKWHENLRRYEGRSQGSRCQKCHG